MRNVFIVSAGLFFSLPSFASAKINWSAPEHLDVMLPSGDAQRVEDLKRSYIGQSGENILENKMSITLETPSSNGLYSLFKRRIYQDKIFVGMVRTLDTDLLGTNSLSVSEQTSVRQNDKGDLEGRLVRDYYTSVERKAPAARFSVSFKPNLLGVSYNVEVFDLNEAGHWTSLVSVENEDLSNCIYLARQELLKPQQIGKAPMADFITSLWSANLTWHGPVSLYQALYPLIQERGFLIDRVNLESLVVHTANALDAIGINSSQLNQWEDLIARLKNSRSTMEKSLTSIPQSEAEMMMDLEAYVRDIQPLMEAPEVAAPSMTRDYQSSTDWAAIAWKDFNSIPAGSAAYQTYLDGLPAVWNAYLSQKKADVYLRTLYLATIDHEMKNVKLALEKARELPRYRRSVENILAQVHKGLADTDRQWKSPIAKNGAMVHPSGMLAFLKISLPAGLIDANSNMRPMAPESLQQGSFELPHLVAIDLKTAAAMIGDKQSWQDPLESLLGNGRSDLLFKLDSQDGVAVTSRIRKLWRSPSSVTPSSRHRRQWVKPPVIQPDPHRRRFVQPDSVRRPERVRRPDVDVRRPERVRRPDVDVRRPERVRRPDVDVRRPERVRRPDEHVRRPVHHLNPSVPPMWERLRNHPINHIEPVRPVVSPTPVRERAINVPHPQRNR